MIGKHQHQWLFHSMPSGAFMLRDGTIKYRAFWYCTKCREVDIVPHVQDRES